jgi:hypothetical protein
MPGARRGRDTLLCTLRAVVPRQTPIAVLSIPVPKRYGCNTDTQLRTIEELRCCCIVHRCITTSPMATALNRFKANIAAGWAGVATSTECALIPRPEAPRGIAAALIAVHTRPVPLRDTAVAQAVVVIIARSVLA